MEQKTKNKILDIMVLVCVYLICNGIPFSLFIKDDIICGILNIIMLILFIFYYMYYIKKYHLPVFKINKFNKRYLLYIPFLLLSVSNFIYCIITKQEINQNINVIELIVEFFKCLLVATCEEIVFRGVIAITIKEKYNTLKTILLSSLIFGGVHILNISSLSSIVPSIIQVGYSFVLGLFLSFMYLSESNIILPILLHFIFNFLNSYLVTEIYNYGWDVMYFIISIIIGAITLAYLFILYYIFKKGEKDNVSRD